METWADLQRAERPLAPDTTCPLDTDLRVWDYRYIKEALAAYN
jgi:hypothetical protein